MLTEEQAIQAPLTDPGLYLRVSALDRAIFESFNYCSDTGNWLNIAAFLFFSEDVEFYHDTDGVTWSQVAMTANTEKMCAEIFTGS